MKNYYLKIGMLLTVLLFTQISFSQKTKNTKGNSMWVDKDIEFVNKTLNKKVYVVLRDISAKEEKRLKRRKLYQEVKEENEAWNIFLKQMVKEEFSSFEDMSYINISEAEAFIQEKNKDVLLLSFVYATDAIKSGNYTTYYTYKRLKLIDVENKKVVAWINFLREDPINLEYVMTIALLKEYIKVGGEPKEFVNALNKKGAEQVRKTILLIPEESTGLTTEEIKEIYPFPFKVLTYNEINKIIKEKKIGYAVLSANRLGKKQGKYTYKITEVSTKRTLILAYKSSVPFFNTKKNEKTIERLYTKNQFEDFKEIILKN